jgi:hypothetical protein
MELCVNRDYSAFGQVRQRTLAGYVEVAATVCRCRAFPLTVGQRGVSFVGVDERQQFGQLPPLVECRSERVGLGWVADRSNSISPFSAVMGNSDGGDVSQSEGSDRRAAPKLR